MKEKNLSLKKIKKDIERIERQKEKLNRGLDQELSELVFRRKQMEEEEFDKLRAGYIGRCFTKKETSLQGEKILYFLILAKDPANENRMECLIVEGNTLRFDTLFLFGPDITKLKLEKSTAEYKFRDYDCREIPVEQFAEKLDKVQSRIDRVLEQFHITGIH